MEVVVETSVEDATRREEAVRDVQGVAVVVLIVMLGLIATLLVALLSI